jgi:hypothetical protein
MATWGGSPQFGDLFAPVLETLLGPRRAPDHPVEDRHRDIAVIWGDPNDLFRMI